MLATLTEAPLAAKTLVYEPKYDGIRALAEVTPKGAVRLWSRNGNEKTSQFPAIVQALAAQAKTLKGPTVLDGEIVALDAAGLAQFYPLLHRRADPYFYAFDCLRLDGRDLRGMPLVKRKRTLRCLVPPQPSRLLYVDHIDGRGVDLFREACRQERIREFWKREVNRLKVLLNSELKQLVAAIRKHSDLSHRLDLIASVDGVGLRTAVAILVRLPEIGTVTREKIAALAGVAPYDNESSEQVRERHIRGGRGRLRKSLFCAALPASFRWNRQLIEIYRRLTAAGKCHKVALIACVRKLLIFVNTVVERGTPWQKQQPRAKADLGLQAT